MESFLSKKKLDIRWFVRFLPLLILMVVSRISIAQPPTTTTTYENGSWNNGTPISSGTSTMDFNVKDELTLSDFDLENTADISGDGTTLTIGSETNTNNFYIATSQWSSSGENGVLHIESGSTVEIWGDVSNYGEIIIEDGGILIIHGDLYSCNYLEVTGTLAVSGNITINDDVSDTSNDQGSYINNGGTIVAGGTFYADSDDTNTGSDIDIYAIGGGYLDGSTTIQDEDQLLEDAEDDADLAAILVSLGILSDIDAPTNFTYTGLEGTNVTLSWDQAKDDDENEYNILLVYSKSSISFVPSSGTTYSATYGTETSSGSGVYIVCLGDYSSYDFTDLVADGITYFKIWSVNSSSEYSAGVSLNIGSSSSTMFYEDFESPTYYWYSYNNSTQNSGDPNGWYRGTAVKYKGSYSAYVSKDYGTSAAYMQDFNRGNGQYYVNYFCSSSIAISDEYKSAQMQFYWKCLGESGKDYGTVLISTDNYNWTEVSDVSLYGSNSWTKEVVDLTDYIGETIYIGFRFRYDTSDGEDPGLCIDEVSITGSSIAPAEDFTATASSSNSVDLGWTLNEANDSVIVAYSPSGTFGSPVSGTYYNTEDNCYISGGGIIIYKGLDTSTTHDIDLSGSVKYAIWSTNAANYSSVQYATVTMPVELPYSQDFEDADDVDEWSLGTGDVNDWVIGTCGDYGGANSTSQAAYISTDKGVSVEYDNTYDSDVDLSLAVDLNGYESATLTFYYMCGGNTNGGKNAYGQVLVNGNAVSLSNTNTGPTGPTGPTQTKLTNISSWTSASVDLSSYVGQVITLTFEWYNDADATVTNPGLCIDEVNITGTIEDPDEFAAENDGSSTDIDLSWKLNEALDEETDTVMIAWTNDNTFGTPEDGKIYSVGDEIDGGGTIYYKGIGIDTVHKPLSYSSIYYYTAWSTRRGLYSDGVNASANTPDKVTVLEEDWESEVDTEDNWETTSTSTNTGYNYWQTFSSDADYLTEDNGNYYSYITYDKQTFPGSGTVNQGAAYSLDNACTATLSTTIDLSDMETCTLTFDWLCNGSVYGMDQAYGYVTLTNTSTSEVVNIGRDDYSNYYYGEATEWQKESIDLSDYCGKSEETAKYTLSFVWYNNKPGGGMSSANNPGFCIDNIEAGGIYTATSSISEGDDREPTSISSIKDTEDEAIEVLDFKFIDASVSGNNPTTTTLRQLKITKGDNNDIEDWSKAIAGAKLVRTDSESDEDTYANNEISGTITSAGITFPDDENDTITIANGGYVSYALEIWLNTGLNDNGIKDGNKFDFALESNDIVTSYGDDFISDQEVSSGAVAIDVEATAIKYTTDPSKYGTVDEVLSSVPVVAGVDENENVDTDFSGTVSISNSETIGMSIYSADATNGYATFTDLSFDAAGTVTLTASCSDFTKTIESTSITIDDYEIPENSTTSSFYINQFVFSNSSDDDLINNTSGVDADDAYGAFLDQSASVERGDTYYITLGVLNAYTTGNRPVTTYTGYAYVWIDWDQSGTFEDDEKATFDSNSVTSNDRNNSVTSLSGSITVPSDATESKTGSTRMRVLFTTTQNSDAVADEGEVAETEDYTIVVSDQAWYGYTTDWTDGENWSKGEEPGSSADVSVNSDPVGTNFPLIDGTVTINSLKIADGANVTLDVGAVVNITNNLVTNDGLVINHSLDNPASLLVSGTITGKATVNLTDNFTYKVYRLLGVTADGVSLSEFDDSYTSGYYAYQYASNAWSKLTSDYDEFDDYPMRGYYIGSKGDGENLSYSGDLHNDDSYTHTSPIRKWQLVCNPYPCYIDITSSAFTLDDNCEQAVYIRRSSDNEVQTYWLDGTTPVSVNSASNLLAPGQGFWVWAEASGAKITIAKAARTNSGGTIGFKSVSTTSDVLKLKMTNGSLEDETVVVFRSDGSDSYSGSDIDKMTNSGTNINFYSLKDDNDLVINLMPEIYDGEVIPLGYSLSSSTSEECTIEVTKISGLSDAEIYLDDLVDGTSVELSSTTEYTFTTSSSSDGRFQIRIASSESTEEDATTTDIDETTNDEISVYSSGQTAYVTVSDEWLQSDSRMIYVYNVAGEIVKTVDLGDLETQFALPGEGVYLIKVVSGSMIYNQKVLGK